MSNQILEDKYYQQSSSKTFTELNTDEQRKRAQFYRERYDSLKAEMIPREAGWDKIEKQYKCERAEIEGSPNSFIPITAPIINGQIASIVDQNIAAKVKGTGPSDQNFASSAQKIVDLALKHNHIKQILKPLVGRYLKFGVGWIALDWDAEALDGFGIAKIRCPQTTKIFIDGNIKDIVDYQSGQYLIEEIGYQSIMWARSEFDDDIADHLMMQTSTNDFDADVTDDERFSFMYLKVWHRNNKGGYLQLMEMDGTGFVLRESDPESHYYEHVDGQYPYYPCGLYQEEGEFHRFGDGQLLYFMQDTINKLYDEVIIACKFTAQSRTFIDPDGQCDPDEFDSDPSHPIACTNPRENVYVANSGTLNPVVERLINNIMQEARRATRFSDLMAGSSPGEKITATQAGIQTNQGNTGINDKKGDVSEAISFAVKYIIGMSMEMWESGQWFRITEDKDDFEWVDARQLTKVPVLIPADAKFTKAWRAAHPNTDIDHMPKYMQYEPKGDVEDEIGDIIAKAGEGQTKRAVFDCDVSIGEGLPTNKMALYNIVLSLAQLQLIDEQTGMPRPLIGFTQGRKMIEELVGIQFEAYVEENEQMLQAAGMQGLANGMVPQQSKVAPVNMNAAVPGANQNGTAMGGGMA
jgi:hypothetical protein